MYSALGAMLSPVSRVFAPSEHRVFRSLRSRDSSQRVFTRPIKFHLPVCSVLRAQAHLLHSPHSGHEWTGLLRCPSLYEALSSGSHSQSTSHFTSQSDTFRAVHCSASVATLAGRGNRHDTLPCPRHTLRTATLLLVFF